MIQRDPTIPFFQPMPGRYVPPKPDTSGRPKSAPQSWPRRPRATLIYTVVALVLLVAGAAVVHYAGPTEQAQSFVDDAYRTLDARAAHDLLCPDAQATIGEAQLQSEFDQHRGEGPANLASVIFNLVSEDFFGEAQVAVGGVAILGSADQPQYLSFDPDKNLLTLRSTGLGWCLTASNLPLSTSTP